MRVVGVQLARRHDVISNGIDQRGKQLAGCANPSGQRRAVEVHAFAGIDLRLPIKRQAVGVLRHQYMREQTWPGKSAINRPRRRWSLHDPVAGVTTQLRSHMADHLETGTNVLQHLGDIFAQFAQPAAAVGAKVIAGHVSVDFARKMLGQRAAEGLRGYGPLCRSDSLRLFDSVGGLQFFKLQLKLFDLRRTFSLFFPKSIRCSFSASNARRSISLVRDLRVAV